MRVKTALLYESDMVDLFMQPCLRHLNFVIGFCRAFASLTLACPVNCVYPVLAMSICHTVYLTHYTVRMVHK